MSKRMGEELIEAMQELLDYSEGKIDLKTSRMAVTPVCEIIGTAEVNCPPPIEAGLAGQPVSRLG